MGDFSNPLTGQIVAFLRAIGLAVHACELSTACFLPGIQIKDGTLWWTRKNFSTRATCSTRRDISQSKPRPGASSPGRMRARTSVRRLARFAGPTRRWFTSAWIPPGVSSCRIQRCLREFHRELHGRFPSGFAVAAMAGAYLERKERPRAKSSSLPAHAALAAGVTILVNPPVA